jgi:hypothetical protein
VLLVRVDRRPHLLGVEEAAAAQRLDLHARKRRRRAALVEQGVGVLAGQHHVAGPGVDRDGGLVGHGAAGDEERRRLAQQLRRHGLEPVHGGVFEVDVVADLGLDHCLAHGGRREGDRIAAQIEGLHRG